MTCAFPLHTLPLHACWVVVNVVARIWGMAEMYAGGALAWRTVALLAGTAAALALHCAAWYLANSYGLALQEREGLLDILSPTELEKKEKGKKKEVVFNQLGMVKDMASNYF